MDINQEWLAEFVQKRLEIELEKANLKYLREYAESFNNFQSQIDLLNARLTKEVARQDNDHNSLWSRQSEKEKELAKLSALVDSIKHQSPSDIPLHQIDEMLKNIKELYELQQIAAINASAYREKVNYLQEETRILDAWCDKNSTRIDAIEKRQDERHVNIKWFSKDELETIKECLNATFCFNAAKIELKKSVLDKIEQVQKC